MNADLDDDPESLIAAAIDTADEAQPGRIDLRKAGLSQREACLAVCDEAEIWRSPDGETFASVNVDGHREHHAVYSRDFKDWMLTQVAARYSQNERPATASDNSVRDARSGLDARAYAERVVHPAPLRAARHEGCVYIDTGWATWQAIEVSPDRWRVIPCSPVPIVRSRRTGPIVVPAERADFRPLRVLLRDLGKAELVLFLSWCLMTLWPSGPYPIGILSGEQGSGKSTKARLAQRLVDPVAGDLLQPPENDRDLIAAAKHGKVLTFDNMSGIKADLADSLCRLSTGSEIGGRALFTNYDSATFAACRPIMLNGIPHLASRGDLADRSLVFKLAALDSHMSEGEFWQKADEALPGALAGLLDALVLGLRLFNDTKTPNVRMADFAKLIVSAEPRLPWRAGAFLEAYAGNRRNIDAVAVEADEVAKRVLAFAENRGSWSGLISEFYAELTETMSPEQRRAVGWPGNARWFSDRLTRAAPPLRALGVNVVSRHGERGTALIIEKIASVASVTSGAAGSGHYQDNGKADATDRLASAENIASAKKPQKSANSQPTDATDASFQLPGSAHANSLKPNAADNTGAAAAKSPARSLSAEVGVSAWTGRL